MNFTSGILSGISWHLDAFTDVPAGDPDFYYKHEQLTRVPLLLIPLPPT